MREVTGSSPVSSTTEKALKLNGFRAFSFALDLVNFRMYDKSTTLLAKKKRFSGGLTGGLNSAEFPRNNLTNSVFLPRTYQSFSLIRREKLLHIPIHDPEQDRREVDPSLCQAPREPTALYERVDVFP